MVRERRETESNTKRVPLCMGPKKYTPLSEYSPLPLQPYQRPAQESRRKHGKVLQKHISDSQKAPISITLLP